MDDAELDALAEALYDPKKDIDVRTNAAKAIGNICARQAASGVDENKEAMRALYYVLSGRIAPLVVQRSAMEAISEVKAARIRIRTNEIDK